MEQISSSAVSTNASYPFSNTLPVCIYDCDDIWPSLHIDKSPLLNRFEWQWISNGNVVNDSSSSVRLSFHLVRTPNLHHPATASAYWHFNPYAHVFLLPAQRLGQSEHSDRVRHFVKSCRDINSHFLVICVTSDVESNSYKKNFEHLNAEITASSRAQNRLVSLSAGISDAQPSNVHTSESDTQRAFLTYVGELVHASVQHRLNSYEQQSIHLWKSRATSSWTFARFVAVKESLAFVFCHLGKRDFSLKQYESLYNYLITTEQKPGTPFSDLPPADAAKGLLNPEFRDYRSYLLDGALSELDLHTFVFACQMILLLQDGKYTQIAEKAVKIVSYVNRRCSELQHASKKPSCSTVFRDIWTFTACRLLSAALAPAIPQTPSSKGSFRFHSSRERHFVRLLAGFHVHALRALQSLANITLPGCLSPENSVVGDRNALLTEALSTTNHKLKTALSNRSAAERLHSGIAYAAAGLYEMGCRSRGAASLDSDAGRVHLRNGSYAEAENLLNGQCSAFVNNRGWDVLHHRERTDLANAENHLGRAQDYLVSCLIMLGMCRPSNSLENHLDLLPSDMKSSSKDATFWFNEAAKTSRNLSRTLKYKAERLFCITVLPNPIPWEDGSAGSVTLRVKSEIPASLLFDYVFAECKCIDLLSSRKSALARRQGPISSGEVSMSLPSGRDMAGPTSPSTSDSNISSEVVVLKSKLKVFIAPGTTDILVYNDEIPHYGRYWVSNIVLCLGQLKIVLAVPKPSLNLVTSTQTGLPKSAISCSSTSPLLDFAVFGAQNPFFFSSRRTLSSVINIEGRHVLYLIPHIRQLIFFKIAALERGIASGSVLDCRLIRPVNSEVSMTTFFPKEGSLGLAVLDEKAQTVDDTALQIHGRTEDEFASVEGTIMRDLNDGEFLTAHVSLDVMEFSFGSKSSQDSADAESESCHLRISFAWNELDGNVNRRFHCDVQSKLIFIPPVEIEGLVQFGSVHLPERHNHGITELSEAGNEWRFGTILFFIKNPAMCKVAFRISSIALDLSPNLEHFSHDESPLDALLPCTLSSNGTFICSFNFLLKHQPLDSVRMPNAANACVSNQHQADKEPGITGDVPEVPTSLSVPKKDCAVQKSTERPLHCTTLSHDASNTSSSFSNSYPAAGASAKKVTIDEKTSAGKFLETKSATKNNMYNTAELLDGNVVLSDAKCTYTDFEDDPLFNSLHVGTLKIQLGIQDSGDAVYERRVDINSPRHISPLTVERKMNFVVEAGKVTNLTVRVHNKSGRDSDVGLIDFEIDADPSVWLVIGRRSGKLRLTMKGSEDTGETGNIKLMAIRCGVHVVPKFKMSFTDGRRIFWDYDDTSSNKSVIILPSVSVVGGCSGCEVSYSAKEQVGNSDGSGPTQKWMPVVVPSDSFFSRS